jgi:hypothetical protein
VSLFRADYGGLASESGEEVYFLGFASQRTRIASATNAFVAE